MPDEEQLRILRQGVETWNVWRAEAGRNTDIDLSGADLREANLSGANLVVADLISANLSGANLFLATLGEANLNSADLVSANLSGADLNSADLASANLSGADLSGADFGFSDLSGSDLREANLRGAILLRTNFNGAILAGADLGEARLNDTVLAAADLSSCINLEAIDHLGPSIIDIRTLQRSGPLPLAFLRGVGLPDAFIAYLPSLLGQAIKHYSCFISYSSKDDAFVQRLYADLQNNGVRCWFAPEDMKIGDKIRDTIDEAIRLRDKVLLVLSEASIASDWVEDEVDKAFEEERQRGGVVLFPVRLDEVVMETTEAWAAKLRRSRHIGNFCGWKDHDTYQRTLERLLRDLRTDAAEPTT